MLQGRVKKLCDILQKMIVLTIYYSEALFSCLVIISFCLAIISSFLVDFLMPASPTSCANHLTVSHRLFIIKILTSRFCNVFSDTFYDTKLKLIHDL